MIGVLFAVAAQLSAALPAAQPTSRAGDTDARLNLMTFNIRLGSVDDGPNHWKLRREMVFDVIREHQPDIAGMQEVIKFQLDEILAARPEYAALGAAREDGKSKGEYSPIVYRKDRLRPLEQGTFWLSETPEVPGSKSWDTACTRVCTWARFREVHTGRTFYHFNTHLDHVSQEAREKGVELILRRIEQREHRDPAFLTGDFNAGEDNPTIRKATAAGLRDTFRVVHADAQEVGTFNSWKGRTDGKKIDYIFIPDGIRVLSADILHDNRDGRYPSDHYPVVATIVLSRSPSDNSRVWPSSAPADCPFPRSEQIAGIAFTGKHAEYTTADTWYPSWAADGNLYSPFTDGEVNGIVSISIGEKATTGHARIVGDDPTQLQVVEAGVHVASALPYGGRYPCGSLVHDGVWYYGTYCLMNEADSTESGHEVDGQMYNWAVLGPFVGFRISRDLGKTWTDPPHTPARPIFPEPLRQGGAVKIGSPHFVDFGKNMEHSPDGKAYLVAHGASNPDPKPRRANASWITGDQVYLLRVSPAPENINDASQYEFFAGYGDGNEPIWTREFARIKPLVDWNNHCGCVTMTYFAAIKKYIMCVTDGWPTVKTFDTYLMESDRITGPFKLVTYMRHFGEQAYFVNFPSKFIAHDGRSAWLCYSANFTNGWLGSKLEADPPGSRYGMCLQEVRLLSPGDLR